MAKLNLLLILITSLFLSNHRPAEDNKLIILSDSLLADKNNNSAEYKGNVKIYFKEYTIHTDQTLLVFDKKAQKTTISKIKFPSKLKIIKKDLSEILLAPNAEYSASNGMIISHGKVFIEYKKMIIATPNLQLYIGQVEDFKKAL